MKASEESQIGDKKSKIDRCQIVISNYSDSARYSPAKQQRINMPTLLLSPVCKEPPEHWRGLFLVRMTRGCFDLLKLVANFIRVNLTFDIFEDKS